MVMQQQNPAMRPALGTALILMIPLVMTYVDRDKALGDGWRWGLMDFIVMGALLFGAGLAFELLSRRVQDTGRKWLIGAAILGVVLVIWVQLAVQGVSQLLQYLFG